VEFYGNGCYNYRMTEELKLLRNPYVMEGEILIIQPVDNMEFISFTKKLIGDLLRYAKTRNL
jgi:hypothetical protein